GMKDTKDNTDRLAEIIALIDQKQSSVKIKLYPLKHASATQLVAIVTKVMAGAGANTKGAKKAVLTVDPRTNTLIIVYPSEKGIDVVENIIENMDQPESAVSLELHPLQFADSSLLAALLAKVFPTPKGGAPKIRVFADKRTNNLILIGHPKTIIKVKGLILKLDTEIEKGEQRKRGNIRVFPLNNASAKTVAEVLQKVAKTIGSAPAAGKDKKSVKPTAVTIIPDIASNSLVIYADSENFPVLENVIQRLDQLRPQVFIQALIMEVKLNKSLDLGIQWQGGGLINEGGITAGSFGTVSGVGGTGGPKTVEGTLKEGAGSVLGIIGSPLTFGGNQYATFNAFVKATQTDQEIDILSSPQILTLNNEEAEIKVGEIIPTIGSTKVNADGSTTTSIEYKEVGISLKITPQINLDNSIELNIDETSSNVIEGSVGAFNQGAITTLNRALKTKIVVNSGETVVLGGLISDEITQVENKTPCLGDIPIMGWLFKVKQTKTTKTNLMIFLSPTVVRTQQELSDLTKRSTDEIRKARANRFRIDVSNEYQMPDMIKKIDIGDEDKKEVAPIEAE
ncbi:MAG: hypothetical protein GY786_09465, partial [Proteobacteria bacterium]|nr:hypothetical protein [Pseudomonadota bacterium]